MRFLIKLLIILGLILFTADALAGLPPTRCREVDEDPEFTCYTFEFSNDTLSQNGTKGIIVTGSTPLTFDSGKLTPSSAKFNDEANPTLPAGIPLKYCKVVGSSVVVMTTAEQTQVDADATSAANATLTNQIDSLNITGKQLAKALINLAIVTDVNLKNQIKTDEGLI